jgi:predicted PurR-regulated permease PerM
VLLADISFADIFWSVLWFFFLVIWIMILVNIVTDLFRDHTVSGIAKTLWIVFLIFMPFLAVIVYLIARGGGMAERSMTQQRRAQEHFASYVHSVAGSSATGGPADEIAKAKDLLDRGAIDQSEFEVLKAKALA